MRLHRFFIDRDLNSKELVLKDKALIKQLKKVLRLEKDDYLILFNENQEVLFVIKEINLERVVLKKEKALRELLENKNEKEIILYCALLKKDNFELVIQKATELGVKEIQPLVTERTVKLNFSFKRAEKIIKEAVEQSGRLNFPFLRPLKDYKDVLLEAQKHNDLNLFFDITGKELREFFLGFLESQRIGLFIGPEGGFSETEKALADKYGFLKLKLSDFTLRAETAALVSVFLVSFFDRSFKKLL